MFARQTQLFQSPSLRGRGLKFSAYVYSVIFVRRRPLCEGVDWNIVDSRPRYCQDVALFARAWIEIAVSYSDYSSESGRPLCEGVDWNIAKKHRRSMSYKVALFARAWIEIKSAIYVAITRYVALFARAWIEMIALISVSLS